MQPAMGPVPKIGHTNPDVLDLPQLAGRAGRARPEGARDVPGRRHEGDRRPPAGHRAGAGPGLGEDRLPGQDLRRLPPRRRGGPWPRAWRRRRRSTRSGRRRSAAAATGRTCPATKVTLQRGREGVGPAPALEGGATDPALLVVPSSRYYDGRGANKVWLHETPDPMTQVVYGSWVEVPAETARSLGVQTGDVLRVESPHGAIEAPGLRVGDPGGRRGGDPDRARAHGVRALRAGRRPEPVRAPAGRAGRGVRRAAAGWASASGSRRPGGARSSPRRPA